MANRIASKSLLILLALVLGLALWWTVGPVTPVSAAPLPQGDSIASPSLVAPEDTGLFTATTAPPVGVPTLKWQAVVGADKYNVQVSASAGFADPVVDAQTYANSYTPEKALADGTYYWRVRAQEDFDWGPYSAVRTFTKDWSDSGHIYPALLSPLDDTSFGAFAHEHFHWSAVPGAATYLLEIATDETFSTIVYSANTIKPHHTPLKRLGNNRYYWRVTPVDHQDRRGQSSPASSFVFAWNVAPQPLGPEDGIESAFLPTFSWTAVEAAEFYQLEISTQPFTEGAEASQLDSVIYASYVTANTEFTPKQALSNDQEYFWRVKAIDNQGTSSPYSDARRFKTRWNFQPRLLTPLNNSIQRAYPFFTWTAIPGVERYQLQVDKSTSFGFPIADVKIYNATTYAHPGWREALIDADFYWRVRGMDAQDNYTPWSDVFSFRVSYTNSPTHVYPLFYYTPDAENMPVHSDRTIAWPVFVWDSSFLYDPDAEGDAVTHVQPDYYVLEVTSDPTFLTVDFRVETAGLSAAPTQANPFNNLPAEGGKLYFWRVRAMQGGAQLGSSEVWLTRIDRSVPQFSVADNITLIYPRDSFEAVEVAPTLGWLPVKNAVQYRVQVSRSSDFSAPVDEAVAQFINYTPWQGRQSAIPFGTFWWRVRAEDKNGAPIGGWSQTRHFNVSRDLVNGNPYDFVPPARPSSILGANAKYDAKFAFIADSPGGPQNEYAIDQLHVMLDRVYNQSYNWVFAFEVDPLFTGDLRYGIYIDSDHVEGSGATTDPLGKPIQTGSLYLPEYVIYLSRSGQTVDAFNSLFASWNGSYWEIAQLSAKGGDSWFSADTSAVQVLVPLTALGAGADEFVGSLAVTVFSTAADLGDGMRDSIPEQGAIIERPAFVSNMVMPLYPFDTPSEDPKNPIVFTELPSLRWRMPYFDSADGYEVQVARDSRFTDLVETWETHESSTWSFFSLMPAAYHSLHAFEDNESYYWRVRIRHERYNSNQNFYDYGPWSPAMRFKLTSEQVGNPTVSTGELAQTTPSFRWQRVEGAAGYTLQVDDDANFSKPIINEKLDSTAFTPLDALPDGVYFWRVATRRSDKVLGQWTPAMEFTKRSIAPVPVAPVGSVVINSLPTFTWWPVFTDTATMRIAAPRYRLQFDDDPNFSQPEKFDTESTSLTINKELFVFHNKFVDGNWYWRVAVIDAKGNVGTYSATQQFYKEYLRPTLIGPKQGQASAQVPNFQWEPLDGAAYYEVRVSDDEHKVDTVFPVKTDNTSYTPTSKFTSNNLFWRVQMYDDDGIPGPSVDGRLENNAEPLYLPMIVSTNEVKP